MKPWLAIAAIGALVPAAAFIAVVGGDRAQPQTSKPASVPANVAPHPPADQPVPFSHKLHMTTGLQCESCHVKPEMSADMSLPSAAICMTCHAEIDKDRPDIKKLAEYAASGKALPWVRIYPLLPGIKYSHVPHLRAGLQCTTCHGNVLDQVAMSKMTAVTSMATCISCHQARQAKAECVTCHGWPSNDLNELGKWLKPAGLPFN